MVSASLASLARNREFEWRGVDLFVRGTRPTFALFLSSIDGCPKTSTLTPPSSIIFPVIQAAASLPNFGIGASFRRTTWPPGGCHWTVTRVAPAADGVHGKAWGVLTWKGVVAKGGVVGGAAVRVRGALKPVWAAVGPETTEAAA